jgi:xylose isomerase
MTSTLTDYFTQIPDIVYEGPDSDNPFAYKYYNPDEQVLGKRMEDWLRFAICYWHTFRGTGADPFGPGTIQRPWEDGTDSLDMALKRTDVVFDFIKKLGLPFYCFHDRDVAPEGATLKETNQNLWAVAKRFKQLQQDTGIKLLWGTANMFSHPRFNQGASTSPNADIFAFCANSVKEAMDVTKELGGQNYVFWGGREGYMSLFNSDLGRETDHLARFLHMAVDYAKEIGFTGQFLIEPKPCEPTKHQYDYDVQTVIGFLRGAGLHEHFKFNIETNHATLAGHEFVHELEMARINGMLGSVDANRGDLMNGWDTDQFPNDVRECTHAMLSIIKNEGLGKGGLNFDAKLRRDSTDLEDFFHAHIGGIDTYARGLRIAAKIIEDGKLDAMVKDRYASWDQGIGQEIEQGKHDFKSLQSYILKKGEAAPTRSGRQELFENVFGSYI